MFSGHAAFSSPESDRNTLIWVIRSFIDRLCRLRQHLGTNTYEKLSNSTAVQSSATLPLGDDEMSQKPHIHQNIATIIARGEF